MVGIPFLNRSSKTIFFCGIGGISMFSLALYSVKKGYIVCGSDTDISDDIRRACQENGIFVYPYHDKTNLTGCDVFVYTAAIAKDNPELLFAKEIGLEIFTRSEFLGAIIGGFSRSIGVSGTHGKSTCTNMVFSVFSACGVRPTLFAGANGKENDALVMGDDDLVIFEACEYNRSFLDMRPKNAVILNIEREHTDIYPTVKDSETAFFHFGTHCENVVLNYGSESCRNVAKRLKDAGVGVRFFSFDRTRNSIFAENLRCEHGFYTFDAVLDGEPFIKDIKLSVSGLHNVSNALAAISLAHMNGLTDTESIKRGIEDFKGLKRRFEYIGSINGADIYDDYAHHPTEIYATVQTAMKMGYKKIICAFQPHTYSRTYAFWKEFTTAFDGCDEVILTDIYPAREQNIYGVSSKALAVQIKNGKYIKNFDDIVSYLRLRSNPQTLILTMGAGKLCDVAKRLADIGGQSNGKK